MTDKPASETLKMTADEYKARVDGDAAALRVIDALKVALHAAEERAQQAEQSLALERAARERAEEDARRYRWLKELPDDLRPNDGELCIAEWDDDWSAWRPQRQRKQLDATIDQALAQEGGK